MKNKLLCLSVMVFVSFLAGCNDSKPTAPYVPRVAKYQINLYSAGVCVGSWTSVSFPQTVGSRGVNRGYEFKDNATGKYVRIIGDIVITELP